MPFSLSECQTGGTLPSGSACWATVGWARSLRIMRTQIWKISAPPVCYSKSALSVLSCVPLWSPGVLCGVFTSEKGCLFGVVHTASWRSPRGLTFYSLCPLLSTQAPLGASLFISLASWTTLRTFMWIY